MCSRQRDLEVASQFLDHCFKGWRVPPILAQKRVPLRPLPCVLSELHAQTDRRPFGITVWR